MRGVIIIVLRSCCSAIDEYVPKRGVILRIVGEAVAVQSMSGDVYVWLALGRLNFRESKKLYKEKGLQGYQRKPGKPFTKGSEGSH